MLLLLCVQVSGLAAGPAEDIAVRAIRQRYAQINARTAKCRRVKKELWGYSLEGGEMTAFFDGDALAKLELTFYGETYRTAEEYYYYDGRLIFLYRRDARYDGLFGKVVRTEESRGYFRDGALIAWIDADGKPAPLGSDRFRDSQRDGLQYSEEFSRAARSPEPEIQAAHFR